MISQKQLQTIQQANKFINIAHGAVRSGKSVALNYLWIAYCKHGPPGELAMVGKTERTLKRNIIKPLSSMLGSDLKYNQGTGELYIGKRVCYVYGANDERSADKIQGATLAGALCDEISLYPQSFWEMLITRLSVPGAQLFGTTNPDSPYHYLKIDWLDNPAIDLFQIKYNIDDNPFLDGDYVHRLKTSFKGIFYKRYILGEWVLAEGVIYDMFSDENVVDNGAGQYTIIGVDYGISNPTVFLKLKFNDASKITVTDEYYYKSDKQKTDTELADAFDKFTAGEQIMAVYCDPSALSFITELKKRRYRIKDADNDVLSGISTVSTMFGNRNLFVAEKCENLRRELSVYSWDSKAQLKGEDKPLKEHDHAPDALRYAVYSHFKNYSAFPVVLSTSKRKNKYSDF